MGEPSRVETALQADLGVYGVGESPSSPSPGPLPWPESTHHSEGPLDGSWDGWRELGHFIPMQINQGKQVINRKN